MSIKSSIKENVFLKKLAHWMLIVPNQYRPRFWIRVFINPFYHKRGKGSAIRRYVRMDVLPYKKFELGDYSIIEDFSIVNNAVGDVIIGNKTLIGIGNVIIGPVTIGNNVIIAQHVVMSGLNHNYENPDLPPVMQGVSTKQITIAEDVWIGANAVITAGISLGKHSIVGAGSIVTKDVPEYSVVAGNPARVIKKYNAQTKLWEKA